MYLQQLLEITLLIHCSRDFITDSFVKELIAIVCVGVFCLPLCLSVPWVGHLQMSELCWVLGTGDTEGCDLPCDCWGSNLGTVEEELVLLLTICLLLI